MIPTPRSVLVAAGAAFAAIPFGSGVLIAAWVAVGLGMAIDWWMTRRRPEVSLEVTEILPRGRAVPFHLHVTGAEGCREVRLVTPPDLVATPDRASGRTLSGDLVAHRRGHHSVGPIATRSVGPMGLGSRHHRIAIEQGVIVYPDVVAARSISRAVASGRFTSEGQRRGPLTGIGTEFDAIRTYQPDDDVRQINWRATMRMGHPMSNVYRIDQDRDITLAVDTGRLMAAPLGQMTRLDAAVDAATAIAYTADLLSDRVGVVGFAGSVLRNLAPRRRGGEGVVRALYDLEPVESDSNYEAAFRAANRSKRGLVVLFTDLLEEAAARPLVDAMPVLARTHAVVVAMVRDEDLIDAVTGDAATGIDPYRSAAALTALDAQRRVVQNLTSLGAMVIEAPADRLGWVAVDAYLDVKRRARV